MFSQLPSTFIARKTREVKLEDIRQGTIKFRRCDMTLAQIATPDFYLPRPACAWHPLAVQLPHSGPRILLVDDEGSFGLLMTRAAKRNQLDLRYFENVEDASRSHAHFDVVILDQFLSNESNGLDYLDCFHGMPVVVISSSLNAQTIRNFSHTVTKFVNKKNGPDLILKKALEAYFASLIF